MIRLARPEDDQLIADLFREFPQNKGTLPSSPTQLFSETIVLFDDNQNLVGTCQLIMMHRAGIPIENLIVHDFCARSSEAEEILRVANIVTAQLCNFEEIWCELVNPLSRHVASMIADGYTFHDKGNGRVLSILGREHFISPALERARERHIQGVVPQFEWTGEKKPFDSLKKFDAPAVASDESFSKDPSPQALLKVLRNLTDPRNKSN
jgi:hypothetical protein